MNGGQIILADEPTGALDSHSGAKVIKLLKQLSADGHTIVLITHDPEVAQHAHRRIDISDGRIISDPGPSPSASEGAKPLEDTAALHDTTPIRTEAMYGTRTAFRS